MAWTYDCNYQTQSYRLTPIFKRLDVRLNYQYCIDNQIQFNHDLFFDKYLNGSSYSVYSAVTAYSKGDRVNYLNKVYECILASTGNLPTVPLYWIEVLNDFRGVVERIKYNCQTLMIEWILNKWFALTFNQPSAGNSDIYIVNNTRDSNTFSVAESSYYLSVFATSEVSETASFSDDFVGDASSYSFSSNFTVFYPVATITSTTSAEYYQMVNLVNKYKIYGSTVAYTSY